jgi:hypothetical protein
VGRSSKVGASSSSGKLFSNVNFIDFDLSSRKSVLLIVICVGVDAN